MALPHGKGLKTEALCFTAHSTKQKRMGKAPIADRYPGIPAFCAWDELLGLGNWLFAFGCDNSTIATGWQVKDFKQQYSSQCRQGRRKNLSSQTIWQNYEKLRFERAFGLCLGRCVDALLSRPRGVLSA